MPTTTTLDLPTMLDIGPLLPMLLVFATALFLLVLDLFMGERPRDHFALVGAFTALVAYVLAEWLNLEIAGPDRGPVFPFSGCLRYDATVIAAHKAILIATAFILLVSPRHLKGRRIPQGEYYALVLFAAGAMMALAASNELLTLFLNLETLSITLYALAGIERENLRSSEAAFKYFLMGSYSSAFLLFGLTMVYGATGQTGFNAISALLASGGAEHKVFLEVGFVMMLAGFAFKLTLVPFHMYAPDLYAGSPTTIGGLIATGSKIAALGALVNFVRLLASWNGLPAGVYWALGGMAVASIAVGNVGALTQPNIKRLLAYSGVAHSGYSLIPLVAVLAIARRPGGQVSVVMAQAEQALSYYFLAYGLMTALAFGVAATLGAQGESNIDRYAGLARKTPLLAAGLALALISLTGVPPTIGFVGKFYLFSVAIDAKLYGLAAFGVLASVASAYYYLKIIVKMYMEEPAEARPETAPLEGLNILALSGGAIAVFLFAIFPMMYL